MLSDLIAGLSQWMSDIVIHIGTPGVTLVALLENLFPPTPSEFLYPLAGKLVYDGVLSFVGVIIAGVVGTLVGATFYYRLGYALGKDRARQWLEAHGTLHLGRWRWTVLSVDAYDSALAAFERHGRKIVILGRIMPFIHGVVSIPAGVVQMSYLQFLFYTAIGAVLWIFPLTVLGYALGSQWEQVLLWIETYQTVVYVLFILVAITWLYHRVRHDAPADTPETSS